MYNELFLGTPDLLTVFVDDGVLVRVDVVSERARRGGPKVWEEFVLGVEGDDRKGEFLEDGSGQGGRGDDGDGCFDDSRWEVLYWDVRKWDTIDDFLELKVDVGVLGFNGRGVLKLWA